MSDTILTNPIVLDETGQLMLDKLDAIISALNPNAQGVSFDKTGCEIITANNVQGALTQLDSGLDDTNSSLTNLPDTMKYGTEDVIDLTNTTTYTATTAGFITGYFRKSADTNNDGLLGITSNKVGNAFVFIQSIPKALNGGYGSVTLPVVKGETLTFATLNNINLSATRISFRPLLMS